MAAKSADDTGNQRNVVTSRGTDYDSGDVKSFRTPSQRDYYRRGQQLQQQQQQQQRDDRLRQLSSLDRYIYTDPRFNSQWNPYRRHPLLQKLLVSSVSCSSSRVRSARYERPTFREMYRLRLGRPTFVFDRKHLFNTVNKKRVGHVDPKTPLIRAISHRFFRVKTTD